MNESRWWQYVTSVAGPAQNTEIADHAGIDKSNLTRWRQGSRPRVEFVLKFARAYGQPVIAALAAAEYITDDEAGIREVKIGAEELSDVDLAEELLRRAQAREQGASGRQSDYDLAARERSRDRGYDLDQ